MSFTVGLGGEGKVTDLALKGALAIVCAKMTDQSALICTGVAAQVALVRRKT